MIVFLLRLSSFHSTGKIIILSQRATFFVLYQAQVLWLSVVEIKFDLGLILRFYNAIGCHKLDSELCVFIFGAKLCFTFHENIFLEILFSLETSFASVYL